MAEETPQQQQQNPTPSDYTRSGYSSETKTFHSLRPPIPLPPPHQPLSLSSYTLHHLLRLSLPTPSSLSSTPFLIQDSSSLSFSRFLLQTRSLSLSLKLSFPSLRKNDVALVLSPTSLSLPVLYFSLLSLGLTLSPVNPLSSPSELTHLLRLSKPSLAFTTSHLSSKLPPDLPTLLLDSPRFQAMLQG